MRVKTSRGQHRRAKHRLTRTLAAALLVSLLIGVPATATMDRPASYTATEER